MAEEKGLVEDSCHVHIAACDWKLWRLIIGENLPDFLIVAQIASYRLGEHADNPHTQTPKMQGKLMNHVGDIQEVPDCHHEAHGNLVVHNHTHQAVGSAISIVHVGVHQQGQKDDIDCLGEDRLGHD